MDKEKLIGLVFVREPIWNKRDRNHHNCFVLNKLWKDLAKELDVPVATAKAQWKRLRQTFIKKLSEEPVKKSGDGADDDDEKDKWAFFDSLLFLKDTCSPRATEGNFSFEDNADNILSGDGSNVSDADGDADPDIGDDSSSQFSVSDSISNSRPASTISTSTPLSKRAKTTRCSAKKDTVGESFIRVEEEKIEYLKRKEENRQKRQEIAEVNARKKEVDEDELFFNSIVPHLKTLDANSKIQFRIGVLQLLQKHLPQTRINNAQSSMEPQFTELQNQQTLLPPSNQPPHFPQNVFNPSINTMYPNLNNQYEN